MARRPWEAPPAPGFFSRSCWDRRKNRSTLLRPTSCLTGAPLTKLLRAIQERHVEVKVITPGRKSDHAMTRSSSRALYGTLLKAGARIAEYQPGMLHQKVLIVDGVWSVVGSTNFDNR